MKPKKILIALTSICFLALIFYQLFFKPIGKILITNGTPFKVLVSINYQSHSDSVYTEGNYLLLPGQHLTFKKKFHNVSPNFKLYYKTTSEDSELVRWYFDLPHKHKGIRDIVTSAKNVNLLTKNEIFTFGDEAQIVRKILNNNSNTSMDLKNSKFENLILEKDDWNWKSHKGEYVIRDKSFLAKKPSDSYSQYAEFLRDSLMFEFEKPGELTLVNTLPHDIFYQYNYQATKDSTISVGWKPLLSGERNNINVLFRGSKPLFKVAVKTPKKDADLIKWWYNYPASDNGVLEYFKDTLLISSIGESFHPVSFINDSICNSDKSSLKYNYFGIMKPTFRETDSTYVSETFITNSDFHELYKISDSIKFNTLELSKVYETKSQFARDSLTKLFVKKGEFEIVNTTPFTIYCAVNFPITKDSAETEGHWKLETGKSITFRKTFKGVDPKINVYASTSYSDSKLIRKAFGLSPNHKGKIYYQPKYSSKGMYAPIKPTEAFHYTTSYNSHSKPEKDSYYVLFDSQKGNYVRNISSSFYNIKDSLYNSNVEFHKGKLLIMERRLPYIYVNESFENQDTAIKTYIAKSKSLRSSFERRIEYTKLMRDNYPSGYFPYMLGISYNNYTSNNELGVKVYDKWMYTNVLGGEVPFNKGDIITSFDGTPVFSSEDLLTLLHNHALSLDGGIANPITFNLARGSDVISGKTLYFFNPNFPWREIPWWKKVLWGLLGAALYGFDDNLYASFTRSDPWKAWQYVQDKSRLVQFSDEGYFTGNIGGMFISPGRFLFQKALKKQIMKIGVRRGIASLATTVILESGEAAVWSFGNRSQVLSNSKFLKEMKKDVLFGAGFGFITGSFSIKTRK